MRLLATPASVDHSFSTHTLGFDEERRRMAKWDRQMSDPIISGKKQIMSCGHTHISVNASLAKDALNA